MLSILKISSEQFAEKWPQNQKNRKATSTTKQNQHAKHIQTNYIKCTNVEMRMSNNLLHKVYKGKWSIFHIAATWQAKDSYYTHSGILSYQAQIQTYVI